MLVDANEEGGETNISTGWHAIEFLLWGQDLSDDGPGAPPGHRLHHGGQRRAPRHLPDRCSPTCSSTTSPRVRRPVGPRGAAPTATTFLADPDQAVADIFRGIGALSAGELAGERMAVAYETKDQEDEHSCFSDNTDADVANNALGIQRVYPAEYAGVERPAPRRRWWPRSTPSSTPQLHGAARRQRQLTAERCPSGRSSQIIQGDDDAPGRTADARRSSTASQDPGRRRSPRRPTRWAYEISLEV